MNTQHGFEFARGALRAALSLSPAQARAVWDSAHAVVSASPGPAGDDLLTTLAHALGVEPLEHPSTTPADVAACFDTPTRRKILADALVVAACIEGHVTSAGQAVVERYARALDVRSHWVDLLDPLRRRAVWRIKLALVRRSPDARRLFARTWAEEGLRGVGRAVLFLLGLHRDRQLAARYRQLAALPAGTLGRKVFDTFVERGLAFPGERRGLPERMMHHDLMHIINGYSTEPAGECELAGFYAGFADGDAFTFIVTVLATFQLGIPVSPAMVLPARMAFDPARVIAAFLRGRRLQVDVMGRWDYWALMPLPLPEAQRQLGLASAA